VHRQRALSTTERARNLPAAAARPNKPSMRLSIGRRLTRHRLSEQDSGHTSELSSRAAREVTDRHDSAERDARKAHASCVD